MAKKQTTTKTTKKKAPAGSSAAQKQPGQLVLIRGLPGSGKSTMAEKDFPGHRLIEADLYFIRNGKYKYKAREAKQAHAWCLAETRAAIAAGTDTVVANIFGTIDSLAPYLELQPNAQIIEAKGTWPSIHPIPAAALARIKKNWEPLPRALINANTNPERTPARGKADNDGPTPQQQVIIWLIEGITEADIRQGIAATWPKENADDLLAIAAEHFRTISHADPDLLRGWALASYQHLYAKMLEIGDFTGALRATEKLLKYTQQAP